MKHFAAFVVVLLLLVFGSCQSKSQVPETTPVNWLPATQPSGQPPKKLVDGNNRFAIDLYQQLAAKTDGPIFFSPLSISTALAMTYAGAKGETAEQMAKTLHFTLPPDELPKAFATQLSRLGDAAQKQGVQLAVADRLWTQKGHPFLDSYLQTVRDYYGVEPTQADFQSDPDAARNEINSWVAKQTNDRIQNIIPSSLLNAATRSVLANAIYFKADWSFPFKEAATSSEPFHVTADKTSDVQMMHQMGECSYAKTDEVQVLGKSYLGGDFSMVIVLPNKTGGLTQVEKSLDAAKLHGWTSILRMAEVRVSLPRFAMTREADLTDTLAGMGMPLAFSTSGADFSGADGMNDLFVAAVLHKAFVEVNETGTEAAAATAVKTDAKDAAPMFEEFKADHPFIFLIRDTHSGSILFMGRFTGPAN